MSGEATTEYILYIGQDRIDPTRFCPGSRKALGVLEGAADDVGVSVQNVHRLREKLGTLPAWLTGTPTLISKSTKKAMRGTSAIEHLEGVVAGQAKEAEGGAGDVWGLTAPNEALHLGVESNYEGGAPDDPSKYSDDRKVTEDDVQKLIERRKMNAGTV